MASLASSKLPEAASAASKSPTDVDASLSTSSRLKDLRKKQTTSDSGIEDIMIEYPATIKARRNLTAEGSCSEAFITYIKPGIYEKENVEGKKVIKTIEPKKEKEGSFVDCFKVGLNFLSDHGKSIKTVKKLLQPDPRNRSKKIVETLPIYIINAHSSVDPRVSLEVYNKEKIEWKAKLLNTTPDAVINEEREYSFIDQLESGLFSINIAPSRYNAKYAARTDFFNTKPDSNVFVIQTSPVGFDGKCGDKNMAKFFSRAASDNYNTFRQTLFSGRFSELFDTEQEDEDEKSNMFTPPGYSVLNKTYQFFDDGKKGWDKWGIIKISDIALTRQIDTTEFIYKNGHILNSIDDKLTQIHPETKLKKDILRTIREGSVISLKEIVTKLGKGIYIDLGCSGMPVRIFDYERKRYSNFGPDEEQLDEFGYPRFEQVMPIYSIIMRDFAEMSYYQKLAWQDIVSTYYETMLGESSAADEDNVSLISNREFSEDLITKSKQLKLDITDVQKRHYLAALKTEKIIEQKYGEPVPSESKRPEGETDASTAETAPMEDSVTPPQSPKKTDKNSDDMFLGSYGGKRKNHTRKKKKKSRKTRKSRKHR